MNIMVSATMTGYMKLMVEAIPLDMFAYPISRVMEVIALRELKRSIFQVSSNEAGISDFFFTIA